MDLTPLFNDAKAQFTLVLVIIVIGVFLHGLYKGRVIEMIGSLVIGAFIYFFINDYTLVLDGIGKWIGKLFGAKS